MFKNIFPGAAGAWIYYLAVELNWPRFLDIYL
jgi:hypothetical protein